MAALGQMAFAALSTSARSSLARPAAAAAREHRRALATPLQEPPRAVRTPAAWHPLRGAAALASAVTLAALSASPRRAALRRVSTAARALRRQRQAVSLTEPELRQLKRGLTVQRQQQSGSSGTGLVVMDVDAPPSLVIERLSAFEEYSKTIPVVRDSQVSSRTTRPDGTVHARADYKISKFRLGVAVCHKVDIAGGTVSFELDSSVGRAVLHEATGTWRVEQLPGNHGGSRVWLEASLRASSLLPHFLVDYASKRALRRATSWLKPHMESLWQKRKMRLLGMKRNPAGDGARRNVPDGVAVGLAHA